MIKILRPILFAFLMSDSVKQLVIDLLAAYAKETERLVRNVSNNRHDTTKQIRVRC
jgi:hypothetical protein